MKDFIVTRIPILIVLMSVLVVANSALATEPITSNAITLPSIGAISPQTVEEEQRIGRAWLMQYRRYAPTLSDPIVTDYLEQLVNQLIPHSDLDYSDISLVVAKNSALNAFAVPGGVVGVHTGLLRYAKTQQQLASVMAHELAHLSQRHYARNREKSKGQNIFNTAAMLAGLILLATTDGDAGIAALSTAQAYALDQKLSFSRSFEREADRIGMNILIKSGMSPHAMEDMFTEMRRLSRFSSQPPEFLLTHPLTNNRIVDAVNLARDYPKKAPEEDINYQFVRARAMLATEKIPQQSIARLKGEISGFNTSIEGSRYGLVLAFMRSDKLGEAEGLLNTLLAKYPNNKILHITQSELLAQQNKVTKAITGLTQFIQQSGSDYPLNFQLSKLYNQQGQYTKANNILLALTETRKDDTLIWYELAETAGLAQQISLLHKARAEYFLLVADFNNARQQLGALITREAKDSTTSKLYIYAQARLKELASLEKLATL